MWRELGGSKGKCQHHDGARDGGHELHLGVLYTCALTRARSRFRHAPNLWPRRPRYDCISCTLLCPCMVHHPWRPAIDNGHPSMGAGGARDQRNRIGYKGPGKQRQPDY